MANPISEHGLGQMKPTPGKTPVPKKTVLPAPPKRRVSLNPAQQAQLNVKRELAPQYASLDAENARQNQAIQAYTTAVMQQLAQSSPQIGQIYDPQIQQQTAMANAAADSLRAVNPSGDVAKLLASVGAPQAQTSQIQGDLNNTFNGGAAVGNYLAGVSPAAALRSQETAAQSLAALQPGFAALAGRQSLASALSDQNIARQKIAAQAPGMIQDQLNNFASNSAKRQQFSYEAQALGIKTNQAQQRIDNQQSQFLAKTRAQIQEFNAKQTTAAAKLANPNSALSAKVGYVVDSNGKAILVNGKRQILPGFNTNKQGRVVKTSKASVAAGKSFGNLTKTQVSTLRATAHELRFGVEVPKTQNGKTVYDKNGQPVMVKKPPLAYGKAIGFLVSHGFSRRDAITMLNNFYPPQARKSAAQKLAAQNSAARQGKDSTGLGIIVP